MLPRCESDGGRPASLTVRQLLNCDYGESAERMRQVLAAVQICAADHFLLDLFGQALLRQSRLMHICQPVYMRSGLGGDSAGVFSYDHCKQLFLINNNHG